MTAYCGCNGGAEESDRGCAEEASGAREPLGFVHAAAEATGLPGASADLVAACLVCHELPAAATRALLAEALRLLRPGGAVCVMVGTVPHKAMPMGGPHSCQIFGSLEVSYRLRAGAVQSTSNVQRSASLAGVGASHRVPAERQKLGLQEMDPASAAFQRVFRNPFAYAAFKSTEPWLLVRAPQQLAWRCVCLFRLRD